MDGEDRAENGETETIAMAKLASPFVLLEDRLNRAAAAQLYVDPTAIIRCDRAEDLNDAFDRLEAGLAKGLHAAGFLAYELCYALEPAMAAWTPVGKDGPLLWFGLFERPRAISAQTLDAAFADLGPPPPIKGLRAGHDRAEHVAKVGQVLGLIRAGDVYQVNLSFPMQFQLEGSPLALYGALRVRQPVAHGALIALGEQTILSVSPELFVEAFDGEATTRPMKGTAPRLTDPGADAAIRARLKADPKEMAENLMIVDLLRNDLSRISVKGSVRTPALFTVETYPTFHALTSTVTAQLRSDTSLRERMAALFPCGSIVGAPKIRAGEIIADLEAAQRGVYTGAIGVIRPGGDMSFNVAIRTAAICADGAGRYGVGGGIVADSDPDAEYDEALLKARVLCNLAADYGLIETFRWSAVEGFIRLSDHLDRLAASAHKLRFPFSWEATKATLDLEAESWLQGDRRVRIVLSRDGAIALSAEFISPPSRETLKMGFAAARLDPGDPFLRHKTTQRATYEEAFSAAVARGLDEAVLLNRDDACADACRNSIFLEKGGRLVTPPLSAGALPGVLRAELIASNQAIEVDIDPDELRGEARWFLGNSLHGLRPARLVEALYE